MSILDLRAHFMRGAKPCNTEKPEPGPQLGWLCTLPIGHDGAHVAHDIDGTIIIRWNDARAARTRDIPPVKGQP